MGLSTGQIFAIVLISGFIALILGGLIFGLLTYYNRDLECRNNSDCPPHNQQNNEGICDTQNNTCIMCLTGNDCFETEICSNNICLMCPLEGDKSNQIIRSNEDNICVECNKDSECSNEKHKCFNHKCLECLNNGDCPSTRPLCSNGTCLACLDDTDCKSYENCIDGICREPCHKDTDCWNLQICDPQKKYCVGCLSSLDCLDSQYKNGDVCLEPEGICAPCQNSGQCPGSSTCYEGKCIRKKCQSTLDCADMEACLSQNNYNKEKICTLVGNICHGSQYCPNGLKCLVTDKAHSRTFSKYEYTCQECNKHNPCPKGQYCKYGVCHKYCNNDLDCLYNSKGQIETLKQGSDVNICLAINSKKKICCPQKQPFGNYCQDHWDCPLLSSHKENYGYCINNICSCQPGEFKDICQHRHDCQSLECQYDPEINLKICNHPQAECWHDYNSSKYNQELEGYCPSLLPYCINGKCSGSNNC